MKTEKTNRRVKYTKLLLKESLLELMKEQPISKISVKMLCEAADINRSTFYAHYTDQYDLLRQMEQEVIAELKEYISKHVFSENSPLTIQAMKRIIDYSAENADLFKVLLSEHGDTPFQRDIMLLAQDKIISDLHNLSIDARTSEYLQSFVINGALSILQKWLQDGMQESTQEMAELAAKLLYQGLSGFYS